MFPIVEARFLAPEVKLFRIAAPRIAKKRKSRLLVLGNPGQALPAWTMAISAQYRITPNATAGAGYRWEDYTIDSCLIP